jgi:hypothetical protein
VRAIFKKERNKKNASHRGSGRGGFVALNVGADGSGAWFPCLSQVWSGFVSVSSR